MPFIEIPGPCYNKDVTIYSESISYKVVPIPRQPSSPRPININDLIKSMTVLLVSPETRFPHILVTLHLNETQTLSDLESFVDSNNAIFDTAKKKLNPSPEIEINIYRFWALQKKELVGIFSRVPSTPQSP